MTAYPRSSILLSFVVLAGCSGADTTSPDQPSSDVDRQVAAAPGSEEVPPQQRQYFADNNITLDEYQEAYSAFVQCANDAGVGDHIREHGRDAATGLINFSTQTMILPPGQSTGTPLNECFITYFAHTETAFQLSDPAVLEAGEQEQMSIFNTGYRPCLEHIGVEIPSDLEPSDENWAQLIEEATRAQADGRCTR